MSKNILVVAVHPDDETLGCGGTLLKHQSQGDNIHWLICTSLESSHKDFSRREEEIAQVKQAYGFFTIHKLGLITTQVDRYKKSEIVKKISDVIEAIQPEIIYLPFKSDVHSDHRDIFEAAYSCTKSFRYPYIKSVYMMETLSETEFAPSTKEDSFIPNVFVDISIYMQTKLKIVQIFKSELGEHPFPRSQRNIKALATFRGAIAGCEYAESFVLLKEIR